MKLENRPYQEGDRDAILELFESAFGFPMSSQYWDWRFAGNPYGPVEARLSWYEDRLMGYFSCSPALMEVDGQEMRAAQAVTSMVHSDCRGQGLYGQLCVELRESMAQDGYRFLYTYPAHRAHRMLVRELDWKDTTPIFMFRLPLEQLRKTPRVASQIEPLEDLSELDALWEKAERPGRILMKRDRRYFQWRYLDHPDPFELLAYRSGGELLGVAVTKDYKGMNLNLVDLVTVNDQEIGLPLAEAVLDRAREGEFTNMDTWLPVRHPLFPGLESFGFWISSPTWIMMNYPLGALPDGIDLSDVRQWHYTQADCDVF